MLTEVCQVEDLFQFYPKLLSSIVNNHEEPLFVYLLNNINDALSSYFELYNGAIVDWKAKKILNGTLYRHLADANERAARMLDQLIVQMAAQEGIIESIKAENPLEWTCKMNSIRSRAEEIIMAEVIQAL